MDEEIKFADLPDPEPRVRKGGAVDPNRNWHLWLTFYAASMIYSWLHKFIIPLALKFLGTSRREYAVISFEVLWPLFLGLRLHYKQKIDRWTYCLMGATTAFAFKEIVRALFETQKSWLFLSHLLASVPVMVAAIALSQFSEIKWTRYWVLGFVLAFLVGAFLKGASL